MTSLGQEQEPSLSSVVFINYYEKDASYAHRLYSDLRAADLSPWIDKEDILPGQDIRRETRRAIKKSDYFIALLSKISVQVRGDVQSQLKLARLVLDEIPEPRIYLVPARLDDCEIPYEDLKAIQYVDLFPTWEEGLERILKAMNVKPEQIKLVIERQRNTSPYNALSVSMAAQQTNNNISQTKLSQLSTFKGEKQFFVGRQVYINQIIKDKLSANGSKVSIVGPGGSGKSQLAFKAIREYLDKDIFDLVLSVYFDEGLITLKNFY